MGIGQNKAIFPIDNHTGSQTGILLTAFKARVEKIPEKLIEEGIETKTGKWAGALAHFVSGTYINHCRTDFTHRFHNGGFGIQFVAITSVCLD
jgi:hypothetical protein